MTVVLGEKGQVYERYPFFEELGKIDFFYIPEKHPVSQKLSKSLFQEWSFVKTCHVAANEDSSLFSKFQNF